VDKRDHAHSGYFVHIKIAVITLILVYKTILECIKLKKNVICHYLLSMFYYYYYYY